MAVKRLFRLSSTWCCAQNLALILYIGARILANILVGDNFCGECGCVSWQDHTLHEGCTFDLNYLALSDLVARPWSQCCGHRFFIIFLARPDRFSPQSQVHVWSRRNAFFWLLAFYLTQAWLWLFIRTLALLCGFFGRFFPLPCRYSRSTWNWKTYHGAASPFAAMFSCSCHSLSISFLWLPGCIHLQDPGPHRSSSQHFCRLCRSRGLDPHDSDPARCVYLVCLVQGCCCPQLGTNPSDFVLWKYQLCSFSAWTHHFRCFSLLFGFDSSIGLAHNLGMIGPQGSRIAFTAWWKKLPAALRPRKIQHPLGRSHCTVGLLGSACFPYWQDIGSWSTPSLARLRMSAGADNFTATSRKKNTSGPPGSGA